jgi:transposase-like protein
MESKHNNKNGKQIYNLSVSEKFKKDLPEGEYEVAFRRWLVRELNDNNMTRTEATVAFNLSGHTLLHDWTKKYSDEHEVSLSSMSPEEKSEKQALEKRIKDLEKKLDSSVMHVKALNTFIDIAEEQLKISIRKKSGTKQ